MSTRTIPCSGALVRDADRRLLVVLRGQAPYAGTWSLPGGRVEPGETTEQACVREVLEETGLTVEVVRHVGRVRRDGAGSAYVIDDYECRVRSGDLRAGSDAAAARWVTDDELRALKLSSRLWETLVGWGEVAAR